MYLNRWMQYLSKDQSDDIKSVWSAEVDLTGTMKHLHEVSAEVISAWVTD